MTDVTQLSDADLMALIQSGGQVQPVDAKTGEALPEAQAQAYRQLGAAGGIDPSAEGGSPRLPLAQRSPEDMAPPGKFYVTPDGKIMQAPDGAGGVPEAINTAVSNVARGVPLLGAWADEGSAAVNAAVSPLVEPMLRGLEKMGVSTPYDEQFRVKEEGDTFGQRYARALNMQRLRDEAADNTNPTATKIEKGVGTVGGIVAGALAAPVLAPVSSAVGPEAGMLARMGAGAVDGALLGGAQGYGEGYGPLDDPSRVTAATLQGGLGAAGGAAFPLAARGLGKVWDATGGKVMARALAQRGGAEAAPAVDEAALARLTGGTPGMPRALAQGPDRDLAEILATVRAAPQVPATKPEIADEAYARIARAARRQGQTPQELADAVAALGPRGVLADSGQSMRDRKSVV